MAFEELKQRAQRDVGCRALRERHRDARRHPRAGSSSGSTRSRASAGSTWPPARARSPSSQPGAAREVTGLDLAPALIETADERAAEQGSRSTTTSATARRSPYDDASFDVVSSTFGRCSRPTTRRPRGELARVVPPGGRLGLANWRPDGRPRGAVHADGAVPARPPPAGAGMPVRLGPRGARRGLLATASSSASRSTCPHSGSSPARSTGSCSRRATARRRRAGRVARRRAAGGAPPLVGRASSTTSYRDGDGIRHAAHVPARPRDAALSASSRRCATRRSSSSRS